VAGNNEMKEDEMANKVISPKDTRTQVMSTIAALEMGVCVTCNSAPTCVNLKATHQPIWFCDQFDDYQPSAVSAGEPHAKVKPTATLLPTNGSLEGLCRTCGNNKSCVNQTPGISKLYCEEYR